MYSAGLEMRMRLIQKTKVAAAMAGLSLMAGSSVGAQSGAAADEAAGKQWWAHVQVLADPSMRGRLTGSAEYLKAAEYVVDQFKADGLEPAGVDGGWYQPVKFNVQRVLADQSAVSLIGKEAGSDTGLKLGLDLILGSRLPQPKIVDAP